MAIECTVTTNLQSTSKGFSGVQKHVEHDDKINHSNKDINFDETQFNLYSNNTQVDKEVDEWNEMKFGDFILEHDKSQREKGHSERQYGSVKNYLSKKKKATGVLTLGNMEIQNQLMERFCKKDSYEILENKDGSSTYKFKLDTKENINEARKFYDCYNRALKRAVVDPNLFFPGKKNEKVYLNEYLKTGRWATNVDEKGACHIHYEVATFGLTRKGNRPTNSLNQALTSLYEAVNGEKASGREATRWFREKIDKYALKCLEFELHQTYKVDQKEQILKFDRKTTHEDVKTGLSMEQLKAQKKEIGKFESQKADLQNQNQKLTEKIKDKQTDYELAELVHKNLKSENENLKNENDDLKKQKQEQKKRIEEMQKQFNEAKSQLAIVQKNKKEEEEKLNKLRQNKRRQADLEAKASEYDRLNSEFGNDKKQGQTLSSAIKEKVNFLKEQNNYLYNAYRDFQKLKKNVIKVMHLEGWLNKKDSDRFVKNPDFADSKIQEFTNAVDSQFEAESRKPKKQSQQSNGRELGD